MPGPVERWLDTFMCGQYAEIFHRFGFETLQSVCQLQLHTLQQMGVKPEDCEKILENVSVLKQTILGYRSTAGSTPPQNVPSLPDPVSGMPAPPHHTPSPGPNPIVNPASSALRNVARNATSRGMSGTPEGSQLDPYSHPSSPGMVGPPPQNFDSAPSKPMYGPPGYVEEQYRPPPTQNVPNPPKVQQQTMGPGSTMMPQYPHPHQVGMADPVPPHPGRLPNDPGGHPGDPARHPGVSPQLSETLAQIEHQARQQQYQIPPPNPRYVQYHQRMQLMARPPGGSWPQSPPPPMYQGQQPGMMGGPPQPGPPHLMGQQQPPRYASPPPYGPSMQQSAGSYPLQEFPPTSMRGTPPPMHPSQQLGMPQHPSMGPGSPPLPQQRAMFLGDPREEGMMYREQQVDMGLYPRIRSPSDGHMGQFVPQRRLSAGEMEGYMGGPAGVPSPVPGGGQVYHHIRPPMSMQSQAGEMYRSPPPPSMDHRGPSPYSVNAQGMDRSAIQGGMGGLSGYRSPMGSVQNPSSPHLMAGREGNHFVYPAQQAQHFSPSPSQIQVRSPVPLGCSSSNTISSPSNMVTSPISNPSPGPAIRSPGMGLHMQGKPVAGYVQSPHGGQSRLPTPGESPGPGPSPSHMQSPHMISSPPQQVHPPPSMYDPPDPLYRTEPSYCRTDTSFSSSTFGRQSPYIPTSSNFISGVSSLNALASQVNNLPNTVQQVPLPADIAPITGGSKPRQRRKTKEGNSMSQNMGPSEGQENAQNYTNPHTPQQMENFRQVDGPPEKRTKLEHPAEPKPSVCSDGIHCGEHEGVSVGFGNATSCGDADFGNGSAGCFSTPTQQGNNVMDETVTGIHKDHNPTCEDHTVERTCPVAKFDGSQNETKPDLFLGLQRPRHSKYRDKDVKEEEDSSKPMCSVASKCCENGCVECCSGNAKDVSSSAVRNSDGSHCEDCGNGDRGKEHVGELLNGPSCKVSVIQSQESLRIQCVTDEKHLPNGPSSSESSDMSGDSGFLSDTPPDVSKTNAGVSPDHPLCAKDSSTSPKRKDAEDMEEKMQVPQGKAANLEPKKEGSKKKKRSRKALSTVTKSLLLHQPAAVAPASPRTVVAYPVIVQVSSSEVTGTTNSMTVTSTTSGSTLVPLQENRSPRSSDVSPKANPRSSEKNSPPNAKCSGDSKHITSPKQPSVITKSPKRNSPNTTTSTVLVSSAHSPSTSTVSSVSPKSSLVLTAGSRGVAALSSSASGSKLQSGVVSPTTSNMTSPNSSKVSAIVSDSSSVSSSATVMTTSPLSIIRTASAGSPNILTLSPKADFTASPRSRRKQNLMPLSDAEEETICITRTVDDKDSSKVKAQLSPGREASQPSSPKKRKLSAIGSPQKTSPKKRPKEERLSTERSLSPKKSPVKDVHKDWSKIHVAEASLSKKENTLSVSTVKISPRENNSHSTCRKLMWDKTESRTKKGGVIKRTSLEKPPSSGTKQSPKYSKSTLESGESSGREEAVNDKKTFQAKVDTTETSPMKVSPVPKKIPSPNSKYVQHVKSDEVKPTDLKPGMIIDGNLVVMPDGSLKKKRGRPFGSKTVNRKVELKGKGEKGEKSPKKKTLSKEPFEFRTTSDGEEISLTKRVETESKPVCKEGSPVVKQKVTEETPPKTVSREATSGLKRMVRDETPTQGPVVRITGQHESPVSCTVINNPNEADSGKSEHKKKKQKNKHHSHLHHSHREKVSSKTTEIDIGSAHPTHPVTHAKWVCSFCGKSPNYKELGDLFGPYYLEGKGKRPLLTQTKTPPKPSVDLKENKSRKSRSRNPSEVGSEPKPGPSGLSSPTSNTPLSKRRHRSQSGGEKGRKAAHKGGAKVAVRKGKEGGSPPCSLEAVVVPMYLDEVWTHDQCAVWASGVFILGGRLHGLEEAIKEARQHSCIECQMVGATLGCGFKGCQLKYHYVCAVDAGCCLSEENFSLMCSEHKNKTIRFVQVSQPRSQQLTPDDPATPDEEHVAEKEAMALEPAGALPAGNTHPCTPSSDADGRKKQGNKSQRKAQSVARREMVGEEASSKQQEHPSTVAAKPEKSLSSSKTSQQKNSVSSSCLPKQEKQSCSTVKSASSKKRNLEKLVTSKIILGKGGLVTKGVSKQESSTPTMSSSDTKSGKGRTEVRSYIDESDDSEDFDYAPPEKGDSGKGENPDAESSSGEDNSSSDTGEETGDSSEDSEEEEEDKKVPDTVYERSSSSTRSGRTVKASRRLDKYLLF
ncbi:transcription factor 20-like isoform X2 [Branchiostoma lanceolatum]|uniref:transcription factor 20-like isoform X2 n=1 Tax=Branchiostoma lanceolatum TaxID=7740 RepID=UPI003451ADE4